MAAPISCPLLSPAAAKQYISRLGLHFDLETGALELYGPEFGLPAAYATHNSFYRWGPPSDSIKTVIGGCIDEDDA